MNLTVLIHIKKTKQNKKLNSEIKIKENYINYVLSIKSIIKSLISFCFFLLPIECKFYTFLKIIFLF